MSELTDLVARLHGSCAVTSSSPQVHRSMALPLGSQQDAVALEAVDL